MNFQQPTGIEIRRGMTVNRTRPIKAHRRTAVSAAVSLVLLTANPATAQNQDETASEELDEVVVTGRFRQSVTDRIPISPEELPFTLNSLDRDLLDQLNYARPIDAIANLPNITIFSDLFNSGTPLMLTRGYFAPVLVDSRLENFSRGTAAQDDSFVSSYEVLKGPASIVVGPVEGGGVFNTITKSPQADSFFGFEVRADQFGSIGGEFDVNTGALGDSDVVSFRVSGAYRDFQYDADRTKRETMAIRPVVVFDFNESTSAKLIASYIEHDLLPNKGFPRFQDGTAPSQIDTDTFVALANGDSLSESTYFAGELVHEFLDNLKLTVRGSHQETDFDYQNTSGLYFYRYGIPVDYPYVFSYSYAGDTDEENTYLDAQLSTYWEWNGQTQDFVIGASHVENKFYREFLYPDYFYDLYVGPISLDDLDTPRYGVDSFNNDFSNLRNDDDSKLDSVYAEAAIRPTDSLTIVGGVRYDRIDSYFERGAVEQKEDETTFRLGATWEVVDDLGLYLSYAEAFTPQEGELVSGGQIGPQTSGGWEFGLKGLAFDGTLNFSAAYFDTERDNVAGRSPLSLPTLPLVEAITQNAKGIEISADWSPTPSFNLNINYGNIDIDVDAADGVDVSDYEYSIPETTYSAFATYQVQYGALSGLTLGGGVRHDDKKPSQLEGFYYDSITLWDAYVSYPFTDRFSAALNVHNLTDELYFESSGTFFGRLTGSHVLGAPRTISLTVRARFDGT